MILLQLGACAEVGGQPTPLESCTPWPPAPPEPSSGDACDVQEATCRAWERCIVIDGRPGECRRDCTLEPCPPGERCEHVDWYDDPGGTGHGTYSSVDSCVAAEDVPERGATGFGPWLYQGDTPAYARSLAVGGGWVAVATDQGPHRGFVAPIRTDGTLGDRVTFDREIRNPVLHRVGGQLHLWSRDVASGGLWSTVLEEDGTLLPGVVVDGPPFGSAMRVVGGRLTVWTYDALQSAPIQADGALGPWETGFLPSDQFGVVSEADGRVWFAAERVWSAPLESLPNPVLAWRIELDEYHVGAEVGCNGIFEVERRPGLAVRGSPLPQAGRAQWRWSDTSPAISEVRASVVDGERIWVLSDRGLWTLPRSP